MLSLHLLLLPACSDDSPSDAGDQSTEVAADAGEDGQLDLSVDPTTPDTTVDDRGTPDVSVDTATTDVYRPDIPITDGTPNPDLPVEDGMRIVGVNPERGPTDGGTKILVIGAGFTVDTDIFLGGVLCDSIDFVDDTKIICFTPPNPAGDYDVKAVSPDDEASKSDAYAYFAPVMATSIDPARGPVLGGMPAIVRGSGFSDLTQVSIAGRLALGIEVIDDTEIRVITPPGEVGQARLQVSNENGLSYVDDAFEYYQPIEIEAILPGAGTFAGGDTVLIVGEGFIETLDLEVSFGLLDVAEMEINEDGDLSVTTPPGPANSFVDVTVSSLENGEYSAADGFYFYGDDAGDLALFNLAPTVGSTAGGTDVVISGLGLDQVTEVKFGSTLATIEEQTATYLVVTTPAHAAGLVDVRVNTASDNVMSEDAFTYIEGIELTSIDPERGDVAGGESFTLTGSGFVTDTVVRFGALPASDLVVGGGGTTIEGLTPPGIVGYADITVTTPAGVVEVMEDGFLYTQAVEIHGVTPTKGAVAGGTYVIVRGTGFIEPITLTFDAAEATNVVVLDSATLSARTPPHEEGYVNVAVTIGEGEPVPAPFRFLYYDPLAITGGSWGDEILGTVNVTVISDSGNPLPDAFVQLSVRVDADYSGTTDANGQVTLSGPDLSGPQTVTATRLGFSSSTVQAVNAENVTVILSCVPENMCGSTADCRPGFVCTCGPPYGMIGICLVDQYCGIEIESQEQYDEMCVPSFDSGPFGVITGQLSGVHKVADPDAGERIMGMVVTTDPHPFQRTPIPSGSGNVLENDGEYTLRSRLGEISLIAVCGIYNDFTETFTAKYIGVRRGLFIVEGEIYDVDIECDIKLDMPLTIKGVNPPLAPGGPDVLRHTVHLHFGSEGYFSGFSPIEGTDDTMTGCCYPPLEGELAGLDYYIIGGAYTGTSAPSSRSILEGVTNTDDVIVLPEFMPVPELIVPVEGGSLVERYFEWRLRTDAVPDFYYLFIEDFYEIRYWDVFVPGDQNTVNLPYWPEDAAVGIFPPGQLILYVYAIDAFSFDYDQFDFNDFSLSNWESFSINAFVFNNPPD